MCKTHINKGVQHATWSHFKDAKFGCKYCYGRCKTTDEVQELIPNKDVIIISDYKGYESPMDCKCKSCGNIWTTTYASLKLGCGCPICGMSKRSKSRTKSNEKFVSDLKDANPFVEPFEEYNGSHTKMKFHCLKCGNIWDGYPSNLLNGSAGCPRCNLSSGERKMLMTLDDFNIEYIQQYSFNDCRNIFPLRFDAFDTINNVGFEYNGEQHYKPINIKSDSYDSEKEFIKIQTRDNIKKKYCEDNKIPLIIIPYWEKNNMRDFLLCEFKKKGIYC